ncbi:MAG: hypothetical protein N4A49_06745 [Marinifilaceae bacterium]|jgi:hypothetical protein|nr:hypothetical protein [Marinifilaceae bacterium]
MALDKAKLEKDISTGINEIDLTEGGVSSKIAKIIACSVDEYIKSATISVAAGITVTTSAGAGTTTSVGTASIS